MVEMGIGSCTTSRYCNYYLAFVSLLCRQKGLWGANEELEQI